MATANPDTRPNQAAASKSVIATEIALTGSSMPPALYAFVSSRPASKIATQAKIANSGGANEIVKKTTARIASETKIDGPNFRPALALIALFSE